MPKAHDGEVTIVNYIKKKIPGPRHLAVTRKQSRGHPKGKMFSPELDFQQSEMVLSWLQYLQM